MQFNNNKLKQNIGETYFCKNFFFFFDGPYCKLFTTRFLFAFSITKLVSLLFCTFCSIKSIADIVVVKFSPDGNEKDTKGSKTKIFIK